MGGERRRSEIEVAGMKRRREGEKRGRFIDSVFDG